MASSLGLRIARPVVIPAAAPISFTGGMVGVAPDPSQFVRVGGPAPLPPATGAPFGPALLPPAPGASFPGGMVGVAPDPSQFVRVGGPAPLPTPTTGGRAPSSFRPIDTFFGAGTVPDGKGQAPPLLAAEGFGGAASFEPSFVESPPGGAPMAYPDAGPAGAEVPGWLLLAAVAVAAFVVLR